MSSLNHSILNDLPLPVPPVAVQKRIMAKADELLSETQRLESIYRQKLAALEELKKSLLHQAFSGQLSDRAVNDIEATTLELQLGSGAEA